MAILAVTGMQAEARMARRAGWAAIVIGGSAAQRLGAVERAIAEGATGLVSFGIAGALDPTLAPGRVLMAEAVELPDGKTISCDAVWREEVCSILKYMTVSPATAGGQSSRSLTLSPRVRGDDEEIGIVFGADDIVMGVNAKHLLFQRTGAAAVDLESGAVARGASTAGIPFIVLRAIADCATRDLPPAARVGLNARGRAALGPVLGSVLSHPRQFPALIRLALDTRVALRALARAVAGTAFANLPITTP